MASLGNPEQPIRLAQNDPLAPTCGEPLLFPRAQNATNGMEGRAGHLGYVLPTDWEVYFDSFLDFSARLLGKAEERVRDPSLHLLCRYLDYSHMGLLQAASDRLQGVYRELWMAYHQPGPRTRGPSERDAVHYRRRSCRIVLEPDRLGDTEDLSRRNIADDDLFAVGRAFFSAYMPVQQHEEGYSLSPLRKHVGTFRIAD